MKILNVINSIQAADGGPIEGIRQLADALSPMGHRVEVVSMDDPGNPEVRRFPLPLYAVGPSWWQYKYSKRLVPWLRQNAARYDAVVVNGLWGYASFGTWRGLRRSGPPYVVFAHGMLDPWFKEEYPLKHLKKSLYWWWADYRVVRDANAILYTCEEERVLARQSFSLYSATERIVGFGTTRPGGDPEKQRRVFLDRFPELQGKRLVLFISRIHPKKGCDLVIEAFARVLAGAPEWRLVMAGPDQVGWQKELEKIAARLGISERITWTGMVTEESKWGALRAAEVMLLPSHQENFGLVVAEALACGVPVLLSHKINIWREVVTHGGGFADEDSADGAARLLAHWLRLPPAPQRETRRRAEECFDSKFEIGRAAASLAETLESIANGDECAHLRA